MGVQAGMKFIIVISIMAGLLNMITGANDFGICSYQGSHHSMLGELIKESSRVLLPKSVMFAPNGIVYSGKTESGIDKDLITVEGDKSDEEDYDIAVTLRIDSSVINFPFNKNDTGEVEPSSRLVISPTRSMPWPVVANSTTTTTCTSTTTTTTTRTTTSSTTHTTTTTRTTYTTTTTTTTTTATATTTTTKTSTRTTTSTTTYTTTSTTTSTSTSTYTTSSSRWGLMPVITPRVSPIGYFPATTSQIILTDTLSPSVTASASSTSATPQSDSTTIKATHSTDAGVVPTACTPTTTSKVTESPEMLSDGVTGCVIGSIASCVFIGCLILLFWEKKRSNTTQGMKFIIMISIMAGLLNMTTVADANDVGICRYQGSDHSGEQIKVNSLVALPKSLMFVPNENIYSGKAGSVNSNSDKDLITIEGDKSDEEDYEIAVTLRIDSFVINFPFNKNDTENIVTSSCSLAISPTRSMPVVANSTCTSTTTCTSTSTRTTTSTTTTTYTTTSTTYTTSTATRTATATTTTTTTKTTTKTTTSTSTSTSTSTRTSTYTTTSTTTSTCWDIMPVITPRVSPIGYFPATTSHIILTGTPSPSVTASASATSTQSTTSQSDSTTIKATHSTDTSVIPTVCTPTTTSKVTESPKMLLVISDGVTGCIVGTIACVFIGTILLLFWKKKRKNITQGIGETVIRPIK